MKDILDLRDRRIAIVADPHLSFVHTEDIHPFCEQLDSLKGVDAFVCLGDLFDFWLGPGNWSVPAFQALKDSLLQLNKRGVKLVFVRGNRDVLLENKDVSEFEGVVVDSLLGGGGEDSVLLSHGDEYCLGDLDYQRLRRNLRRPWLRSLLRFLPWSLRRWMGLRMRAFSSTAVARKPLDALALREEAVRAACNKAGCHQALIGHLHRSEARDLSGGISLRVLSAWVPGSPFEILG
ncbi:MAG: metallophosphoesterase [Planctomycetota bacterium]|nr:metallophosphoesterase [Planctomycetota bacterium]MDP6940566.1 metallophosphoesterase [Planctomycetota bacterium]